MKLRTTFPAALMLGLGLFLLDPSPAAAAEVMCSNDYGHCTVSNNNGSHISCSCGDSGGDEGTGGDDFEGMSEEELLEVCEDAVAFCEDNGEGGEAESGTTGADPTAGEEEGGVDGEEGDTDDEPGTTGATSGGEEGFPGDDEGEAGTDGAESDGDPEETTGDSGGDSGGDGNSTGEGDSGGDSEGDPETTGDSGGDSGGEGNSTGDESPGGEEEGQQESGDGETGSPADEVEGGGGCSVATNSGLGLLGLALLGLFGLHRRERQQVV